MNKKFVEEYRGFSIYRMGNGLEIYDKNGNYVKREDCLLVNAARIKIDKIIANNRKWQ